MELDRPRARQGSGGRPLNRVPKIDLTRVPLNEREAREQMAVVSTSSFGKLLIKSKSRQNK